MQIIQQIKTLLLSNQDPQLQVKAFFKTDLGQYGAHDQFLGISVPKLRKIATQFKDLDLKIIQVFLQSTFNEERLLALILLVTQYQKARSLQQLQIYNFYLQHLNYVNNWNLVDTSAPLLMGQHLYTRNKQVLFTLAKSNNLWHKRIAIVATWYFIRQNKVRVTFRLAKILLADEHDLIHKAVGWMLREAGKRDLLQLKLFLDQHAPQMPRTMLRYAIERFPAPLRKAYLLNSKTKG